MVLKMVVAVARTVGLVIEQKYRHCSMSLLVFVAVVFVFSITWHHYHRQELEMKEKKL